MHNNTWQLYTSRPAGYIASCVATLAADTWPTYPLGAAFADALLRAATWQGGVIGGCGELCGMLSTQWEATACNLVCDVVGIEGFMDALDKVDLDPIYYCHVVDLCKEFQDASATVTQLGVNPASGTQFTFTADITVNSTVGAGEVALQFYDDSGAFVGGGASPVSGADVGEFTTSLGYDNTQTDEPLDKGTYTATFYFCQGECGSSHPISKILGSASTTFTIDQDPPTGFPPMGPGESVIKMITERDN